MTDVPTAFCESMLEVARAINSSLSLSQVLDRIAEATARTMRAKACSIRLLNKVDQTLSVRATYGLSERYLGKGSVQVSRSPMDREALRGNVVVIEDARTDRRLQYPQAAAEEGISSMLVAPLVARGTAIGVIRIYTAEPRRFDLLETHFLRVVAELAAVAIENARVHDNLVAEIRSLRQQKAAPAERSGRSG